MTRFPDIESSLIRLPESDIDTDQIFPARFLRTAAATGLADCLFHDRRSNPDFPFHPDRYRGESLLLAGPNFGCGSSREHAPWALRDFGIKAIISTSFADIFFNNCLKNGLLPIVVDAVAWLDLAHAREPVRVSLSLSQLESEYGVVAFRLDPFARYCLLQGLSELDFILQNEPAIAAFESSSHRRVPPLHEGLRS